MLHLRSASLAVAFDRLSLAPTMSHAAVPIHGPFVALATVADGSSAVPGGSGAFTDFIPTDPITQPDLCIRASNIAFWGAGVSCCAYIQWQQFRHMGGDPSCPTRACISGEQAP
jgi:hypothetical protein